MHKKVIWERKDLFILIMWYNVSWVISTSFFGSEVDSYEI